MTESEHPDPTKSQVLLAMSKPMQIVFSVVFAIAVLSEFEFWMNQPEGARPGFAFGGMRAPEIDPIGDSFEFQAMDLKINAPDGFRFYHVRSPETPSRHSVAFVNSASRVMGSIRLFDAESAEWAPDRLSFGETLSLNHGELQDLIESLETVEPADETTATKEKAPTEERRGFPFDTDPFAPRIRGTTVDYSGYQCLWMTPRKSPSWPSRVHLGRFESENHPTLLVRLYELSATDETPRYDSGVIAQLGNALIPKS